MPTLVLLRHAKSAYPENVSDHDRPLSERGLREAPVAGEQLAERMPSFDRALVSSGLRAQQTWEAVSQSLSVGQQLDMPELYLAGSDELLGVVRQLFDSTRSVLMVGHNEGIEELASMLSGVPVTMKTSTFAILRSDVGWRDWGPGTASLDEVVIAR
ncbi:MAG: histidine phosphatase family protein [Actinomycetia bacterium]|nr:histidine phosphatase family protein [Actinomycetes bacterium]